MEKDILVILMVAFGLFAIVMFILFFIYLKKYYNSKHIEEDYKKELDNEEIDEVLEPSEPVTVTPVTPVAPVVAVPIKETPVVEPVPLQEDDMEFVPIKKK